MLVSMQDQKGQQLPKIFGTRLRRRNLSCVCGTISHRRIVSFGFTHKILILLTFSQNALLMELTCAFNFDSKCVGTGVEAEKLRTTENFYLQP